MPTPAIPSNCELEALLQPVLGPHLIVSNCSSQNGTQPGENYGSTMLAAEITFQQHQGASTETLRVMMKLAPPTEFLQNIFNISITFCKEINMYKLVIPEFHRIQKEKSISEEEMLDIFPQCYGARTSLAGNLDSPADANAVLMLENLRFSGYALVDRLTGLNFQHSQLALSALAQFHALPIALKQLKPLIFKETVLKTTVFPSLGPVTESELDKFLESLAQTIPECLPYMDKMRKRCLQCITDTTPGKPNEPFATIVHNDFWTNNMMFQYSESDKSPSAIKFVDFQTTLYSSPANDIVFFLYTSVEEGIRKTYYEQLLHHYHENFVHCLHRLGCNTNDFTFENFEEEINLFAPTQFYHILFMLSIACADNSTVVELSTVTDGNDIDAKLKGPVFRAKFLQFVEEFEQKGWL